MFCEFACTHDVHPDHFPRLAEKADVLNNHPGSSYVDCAMGDQERRSKLPTVVSFLKSVFDQLVPHKDGNALSSHSDEEASRLKHYGRLGKLNPQIMSWSCSNHCEYECMHHALLSIGEPVKFFGKWPFQRVFICQEFLSSVYSLLNALPYVIILLFARFRKLLTRESQFYCALVAVMWTASGLFHCRDTNLTMHIDYLTAFAGVVGNLWLAVYWMTPPNLRFRVNALHFLIWLAHVSYLTFVDFNFEWNMIVATVFAFIANSAWTLWYFRNRSTHSHAWMVLVSAWSLVPLFLLMEANDFPPGPLGLADAHSFWHLSTVPLSVLWCVFFQRQGILNAAKSD